MDNQSSGILAGVGGLFYMALLILTLVGLWKLFEKAGKPGWASLIPIYNVVVMFEIIGKPLWQILLIFIPIIGWLYLWFTVAIGLCKSYGKTDTLSYILSLFFGSIYLTYLGLSKEVRYVGPSEGPGAAGSSGFNSTSSPTY